MSCVILAFLLFVHECLRFRWSMLKSFYRSANATFGKVGRVAKEDVVLQLLSSKCLPSLLYGLEACPLVKSDLSSLDFVINRFFMKLFKSNNQMWSKLVNSISISWCQALFGQNVLHLSKINFLVPKMYSVKLQGTQCVLACSNDMFM